MTSLYPSSYHTYIRPRITTTFSLLQWKQNSDKEECRRNTHYKKYAHDSRDRKASALTNDNPQALKRWLSITTNKSIKAYMRIIRNVTSKRSRDFDLSTDRKQDNIELHSCLLRKQMDQNQMENSPLRVWLASGFKEPFPLCTSTI